MRRSPVLTAHLLLLGVVLLWGSTFALVKAALADASPLLFNTLRMLVGFVALLLFDPRPLKGLHGPARRDALHFSLLAGLCLGLGYEFQTAGLLRTTSSKSAFVTGLVVVLVPLLGVIPGVRPASIQRPRWPAFAGAAIALGGLLLLTTPPGAKSSLWAGIGMGEGLTLLCAFCFAAHLLTLAHAAHRVPAQTLGTLQVGVSALLMILLLPFGGHPHLHFSGTLLLALGVTGILATAAAFTIQSWAQQYLPASHIALLFILEPVFAYLTALLFFGERLRPRSLMGAGLILASILLVELWPTPAQPIAPTA